MIHVLCAVARGLERDYPLTERCRVTHLYQIREVFGFAEAPASNTRSTLNFLAIIAYRPNNSNILGFEISLPNRYI